MSHANKIAQCKSDRLYRSARVSARYNLTRTGKEGIVKRLPPELQRVVMNKMERTIENVKFYVNEELIPVNEDCYIKFGNISYFSNMNIDDDYDASQTPEFVRRDATIQLSNLGLYYFGVTDYQIRSLPEGWYAVPYEHQRTIQTGYETSEPGVFLEFFPPVSQDSVPVVGSDHITELTLAFLRRHPTREDKSINPKLGYEVLFKLQVSPSITIHFKALLKARQCRRGFFPINVVLSRGELFITRIDFRGLWDSEIMDDRPTLQEFIEE